MRKSHVWALAAFIATLGVILGVATPAQSQKQAPKSQLPALVAKKTKLAEVDVNKMLEALGPIIREQLASGETVELPGLGLFRVVRIPEHKDMVQGRPATIAATNNVEMIPTDATVRAANAPTAVPAVTVPVFDFNPLPDQTKGLKSPGTRMPSTRQP